MYTRVRTRIHKLYMSDPSNIVLKSQEVEATQTPIDE